MPNRRAGFSRGRRWGQNFLVNAGAADRIIEAFRPGPSDLVLEVGPGRGVLTRRLAGRVRRLVAVEVDPDLAASLRADLAAWAASPQAPPGTPAGAGRKGRGAPEGSGALQIVEADVLDLDLGDLLRGLGATPRTPARMIANLPYNIATPLILRLLEQGPLVLDLLVMVQREVAARILSPPGSRQYGGLSVLCQARARVESVLRLRPGSFRPSPKVDFEAIRLTLRSPEEPAATGDPRALSGLLRVAFERRRKTLVNNLARLPWGDGGRALGPDAAAGLIRAAGLDPGCRPEEVPVQGYLALLSARRAL